MEVSFCATLYTLEHSEIGCSLFALGCVHFPFNVVGKATFAKSMVLCCSYKMGKISEGV